MHLGVNYIGHVHLAQLLLENMINQVCSSFLIVPQRACTHTAALHSSQSAISCAPHDTGHGSTLFMQLWCCWLAQGLR